MIMNDGVEWAMMMMMMINWWVKVKDSRVIVFLPRQINASNLMACSPLDKWVLSSDLGHDDDDTDDDDDDKDDNDDN